MLDDQPGFNNSKTGKKTAGWLIFAVISCVFLGFFVRVAFEVGGFESLSSDELLYYKMLFMQVHAPQSDNFIPEWRRLTDFQEWIPAALYFVSDGKIESIAVGICFFNVMISFLFSLLLFRRTGSFWAIVPFLVFMVFPMPAISYWGTQISELRAYFFYAVILLWFAGRWFKDRLTVFCFGFLGAWGCWANLLTAFFILPVLFYERERWFADSWKIRFEKVALLLSGVFAASLFCFQSAPWARWSQHGYTHYGFHSLEQLKNYAYLFFVIWPVYWFGGIPWGYLHNSQLGRFLNPGLESWEMTSAPFVFWFLWSWALMGTWMALKRRGKLNELVWGWGPAVLLALFFIFGAQSWDALTLRYLAFWQFFLPTTLGLWASCLINPFKNFQWCLVVGLWAAVHGFLLIEYFIKAPHENPGHHIEVVLEKNGYEAGYANYWVADLVNYYSGGRVLLEPYNHAPLNKKALAASREKNHVALVWVRGLDLPGSLPEVFRQLRSLGYLPSEKLDFEGEDWMILGFTRKNSPVRGGNNKS